ncbi:hypothetical protein NQ318_016180 [Aromia moschata]|uniref:Uncharacterized protein n=1 Tax=Aromia moschata TaxID=1265417 RepID=A0AAV8X796_9CUCU|nr:hypothetical protein NQ318_016180 [Aromia moschata]
MLTGNVARHLNYLGKRSDKRAFCDLALKKIIVVQLQERNIELQIHIKEQNKQILTIIGKQDKAPFSSLPGLAH